MTSVIILTIVNLIIIYKINEINRVLKIYDVPNQLRKIHKNKVSKIGGIIILINILIYSLFELFMFNLESSINVIFLLFISILIFLIGLIDDIKDLKPNLKLFLCSLIILIFLFYENNFLISNLRFSFMERQVNLGLFSLLFTTFCIVVFINALNMFDGINLQVILYSSFIFIVNSFISKNYLEILLFLPLIITLIFLNFKNKLFLGDNGSLLLGFIISCVFIFNYNNSIINYADTIFIFMMLPGIELIRLAVSRILKKKNPFSADNNHIHHILLRKFKYNTVISINFVAILIPVVVNFYSPISSLSIIIVFTIIYFLSIYLISKV